MLHDFVLRSGVKAQGKVKGVGKPRTTCCVSPNPMIAMIAMIAMMAMIAMTVRELSRPKPKRQMKRVQTEGSTCSALCSTAEESDDVGSPL